MKENKSAITTPTTPTKLFQVQSLNAVTLFRMAFGIVWLLDGALKLFWCQPSDVVMLVQKASQGQPAWLHPWYNFWTASLASTPTAFLHGIALIEVSLGLALIIGFMRKTIYLGGIMLSLMIWAIVEGFGGPYRPGSTDIGAAIMYAFIFIAIIILERSSDYSKNSLDVLIERKLNGWKHIAELYDEKSSSKRLNEFQTACKTILPKVDPLLVEDMILHQQRSPQEQPMYTIDILSDGGRNPDDVKTDILADTGMVPSIYEHGTHYIVNQKICLETLEKIQKYPDVQEIKGEYSGSYASKRTSS
jgi:nitrite reductase (NO-forming)